MSLGISAVGWMAIAAATSAAVSYDQGEKNRKAQNEAMDQAKAAANESARQQDMAFNKANGKKPDLAAIFAGNKGAAGGGTMLTGPSGVDPSALSLSKTTLLGS